MKNLSTETFYWAVTSPLHHLPRVVFRQRFSHQLTEERSENKKPTTSRQLFNMMLQLGNIVHCNPHFSFLLTLSLLLSQTPVERGVMAKGEREHWVGGRALFHDGCQDPLLSAPAIVPDANPYSNSLLIVLFSCKKWWFLLKYCAVTHKSSVFGQYG